MVSSKKIAAALALIAGGADAYPRELTFSATPDGAVHVKGDATFDKHVHVTNGKLLVDRAEDSTTSAYPVIEGARQRDITWPAQTASGLTATRHTSTHQADFQPGFGADISFQTHDGDGHVNEMGVIGGQITGHLDADGNDMSELVFKTWSGADLNGYEGDADGKYNRLIIGEHYTKHDAYIGVPNGKVDVHRQETEYTSGYPVIDGTRLRPSWPAQTASGLTATRQSDVQVAEYKHGFGVDVAFQTTDTGGHTHELGVIGMQHHHIDDQGHTHGEIVFKLWDGADQDGYPGDVEGLHTVVTMSKDNGVHVMGDNADVTVNGVSFNDLAMRIAALERHNERHDEEVTSGATRGRA